jgi:hypothetical protein
MFLFELPTFEAAVNSINQPDQFHGYAELSSSLKHRLCRCLVNNVLLHSNPMVPLQYLTHAEYLISRGSMK